MFLVPGASAAVVKVAAPLLSATLSRMLPLLSSVNVTEPAGVPVAAVTWAVNLTHESYLLDVTDELSVVVVATVTAARGAAAAAAAGGPRLTAAASPAPIRIRRSVRTPATFRWPTDRKVAQPAPGAVPGARFANLLDNGAPQQRLSTTSGPHMRRDYASHHRHVAPEQADPRVYRPPVFG